MADASDCRRGASSQAAAHSPADSLLLGTAPALEDVVEEEDVFLPQDSAARSGTAADGGVQGDGQACPGKQLESEFLHLTIRKQVSYR